jgi:AcrR family transcriptional regulator
VRESGAPIGSIYYRFRSVDQLLARLWIRAAQRSHAVVQEVRSDDPIETIVAGALSLYELCLREPEDALLLASFRPADFSHLDLGDELRRELATVNAPIERPLREVTRAIFGRVDPGALDIVVLALVELPYTFARRQIGMDIGTDPDRPRRLEACVRAVLAAPGGKSSEGHRRQGPSKVTPKGGDEK